MRTGEIDISAEIKKVTASLRTDLNKIKSKFLGVNEGLLIFRVNSKGAISTVKIPSSREGLSLLEECMDQAKIHVNDPNVIEKAKEQIDAIKAKKS